MVNCPCSFVVAVSSSAVALFFATTEAPGRIAPEASTTVPAMIVVPLPPCANADVANGSSAANRIPISLNLIGNALKRKRNDGPP
jgi:hypothetical protein